MAVFEYVLRDLPGLRCVAMSGRLDALSSSSIQKIFEDLVLEGERTIVADMAAVTYVSSAGLRVFLVAQKELTKVGGEIVLSGITEQVFEIFRMSGFTKVFRMVRDPEEAAGLSSGGAPQGEVVTREIDGILTEYVEREAAKGSLHIMGSQGKAETASFTEADVVEVRPEDMEFGCSLAALGSSWDEYKGLFGESMAVRNNFFFYPAVKHSSVDFVLNAHEDPGITYKVLHGFGFGGAYKYVLFFKDAGSAAADLSSLVRSFFDISKANLLGLVIVAESKGVWAMHLKQPPIVEMRPAKGASIFDNDNFPHWVDFPVEPAFVNHVVVATGIAVRDRASVSPAIQALVTEKNAFHIHGAVFDRAPIGTRIDGLDEEITRIFNDLSVHRVQHFLGKSRFSGGMAGIIDLEA